MKLVVRAVTALALLGLAAPALPCPSMKTTQAEAQPAPAKEEAQPAKEKEKVAKTEKGAKAQKTKDPRAQKAAPTAAN